MCEIYDMIENKGIEKGIKKGREEGIVLGGVRMLCSLVQNNMLTVEKAAAAAGLSAAAFQKELEMNARQSNSAAGSWQQI